MSAHFTPTDEMLLLAETLGEVKTKTEKLEAEFSTQARPLEAATNALSAALAGIKALQFHVLDNNLGALSARVEEMRRAVDEQVGVIALELKKADETNAAKAGQDAEALRAEIAGLQAQLGTLGAQFTAQLARVEFAAKEEAKALQLIPGPAGATGASLNPRGTFVDGETYNRLDVVSWLGSSYIAGVDGVTEKPSKNSNQWQVLASRGGGAAGGAGDFGSLAGVAQINQGGTGQTTRAAGLNALLPDQAGNTQYMLLTDGAGTVSWGAQPVAGLPSQTSNGGKLLTTDGTNASWSGALTVSGSNATVTGNLTVNGTSAFSGLIQLNNNVAQYWLDSGATQRRSALVSSGNAVYFGPVDAGWGSTGYFSAGTSLILRTNGASGTFNEAVSISTGGNLTIAATTASTTTSSGALVVSGGVGVGGAINAGGDITASGATMKSVGFHVPGNGAARPANTDSYLAATAASSIPLYVSGYTGGGQSADILRVSLNSSSDWFSVKGNGQVSCLATTASTSTSSGSLVCSGGVGVAGAIYGGGDIISSGNGNIQGGRFTSVNSNSYIEQSGTDFTYVTGGSRPHVFSIGGTTRFQVTTSGIISSLPASAASLTVNSTMTFELTSNTSLKISVRGTDGTTRSVSLTLA